MRLFRHFNAPLEKSFTVVYWDQRGAGKSFDRKISKSSMTIEQFIADLDELVEAVCKRVGQNKVTIFGHSWGSALGVLYAARFPEKVAAYIGSGQIGDWQASEALSYAFALAEAQRRDNRKALRELRAIGPPPHTAQQLVDRALVATALRRSARGKSPVEYGTNRSRSDGIIGLRSAQPPAWFPVLSRRHVGRSVDAESHAARARAADASPSSFSGATTIGSPQKSAWPISTC